MNSTATLRVFRFDPDADVSPRYEEYQVAVEDPVSVLVLLSRIQKEQDRTLALRDYSCGLQLCGSCLMKINGKKKFACHELVRGGETLTVEPLSFPDRHVRDLVSIDTDQGATVCPNQ
jgi:succinate dehydrogenase / fumarate reductase iron-sulfur subunit